MYDCRKQKTIRSEASCVGVGIHTGQEVELRFVPAKEGCGIVFRRVDLSGKPEIPATVEYIVDTARGTTVAVGDVKVHTVEHVLAALRAYEIDNVYVELTGIEPPAGNGSADVFVELLDRVGVIDQTADIPIATLQHPVWLKMQDTSLVALPADTYQISYTMDYTNTPVLGSQYFLFEVSQSRFVEEIASARTFALYNELSSLMDLGLIRGGSLENAVVVQDNAIISKGGLYYRNEAVRHKILDLLGDLTLVGLPFTAHIIALRSGHASNCEFAKKLYRHLTSEAKK